MLYYMIINDEKKLLGFDCYTVANLKQNSVNGAECRWDEVA